MPIDMLPYVPVAALCISVLALFVSGANLGWNIYREVALRARVKLNFGVRAIVGTAKPDLTKIVLSITNIGPGVIHPQMILYRKASLWRRITRRSEQGVIMHDWTDKLSAKLPAKLEVGERMDVLLPYRADALDDDTTHIGVSDSFGRSHWVSPRDLKETLAHLRKDFPKK